MSGVPTTCYDLQAVSRFLRAVAQAIAMQQHTHVHWQPYRESAVINAIYTVLAWKEPPGTVEVISDSAKIEHRTNELHERFLLAWLDHLSQNPQRAAEYLEQMQKLRQYALKAVQEAMADARSINSEILGETNRAIRNLQTIKLGSTIAVAGIGVVASFTFVGGAAVVATGANLTYGVGCALAKSWHDTGKARVVAVSTTLAKEAVNQGIEKGTGRAGNSLQASITANEKIVEKAARKIQDASNRLSKEGLSRTARRTANRNLGSASQQLSTAQGAVTRSTNLLKGTRVVARTAPVVFALWDVFDEVKDTMAIWDQTR